MSVKRHSNGDDDRCVRLDKTVRTSPVATSNSQPFVRCSRQACLLFGLVSVYTKSLTRWMSIKAGNSQSKLVSDAMYTANYTTYQLGALPRQLQPCVPHTLAGPSPSPCATTPALTQTLVTYEILSGSPQNKVCHEAGTTAQVVGHTK